MTLKKIKLNAIILVCIIITISFLFLGLYNYSISKKEIHNELVNSSIPLLRDSIFSEIEKSFLPALGVASVMSKDSFLINWTVNYEKIETESIIEYLKKMRAEFNYHTTFFVSSNTLKYYYYDGINKTINRSNTHDQWYYDFIESGLPYELDVDFDELDNNKLTIFINYKVLDFNGKLLGVTGIGIEMGSFSKFLKDQQSKYNRKIYLTDKHGVIQAHSDLTEIEKSNIFEIDGLSLIAKDLLIQSTETPMLSYQKDDKHILISSKYIQDINWYLIVEQNETESLEVTNQNLKRTIIVGVILLITILTLIIFVLNFFSKKLEILAVTDPLTGTYNRREFHRLLMRGLDRKGRSGTNLTLITIDIDHFKNINDTLGHPFGDLALTSITNLIIGLKRPNDILSRLGGDEFAIILEGSELDGLNLANRIKNELSNFIIRDKKSKSTTISLSMGVYEADENDTSETTINMSDRALYYAKNSGRNSIKTLT